MTPIEIVSEFAYELDSTTLTEFIGLHVQILLIGCGFCIITGLIIFGAVKVFNSLIKA